MNLFDRFLDTFSMTDLKKRVRAVVAGGIALCIAAIAGGAYFLSATYSIGIEGTGKWQDLESPVIDVQLKSEDMERLRATSISVEFASADGKTLRVPVQIRAIEPDTASVRIEAPGIPEGLKARNRFDIRLVLIEEPFWKLLWVDGKEGHAAN